MVSVVELVDTPDCGSGAMALRVQVSSLTPKGPVRALGAELQSELEGRLIGFDLGSRCQGG